MAEEPVRAIPEKTWMFMFSMNVNAPGNAELDMEGKAYMGTLTPVKEDDQAPSVIGVVPGLHEGSEYFWLIGPTGKRIMLVVVPHNDAVVSRLIMENL